MYRLAAIFFLLTSLCWSNLLQAQSGDSVSGSGNKSSTETVTLPQPATASNAAFSLTINNATLFDSIQGARPQSEQFLFLVVNATLKNVITPELVFDHDIAEELVFHHFDVHGPFLSWNNEHVFGRLNPENINNGNPFPDPAYLSFEGDSITGEFVYEVPREQPAMGATLLWPDERFDLLALDLFSAPTFADINSELFDSNGDFHLRVHDVSIENDGVSLSLSGYRTAAATSVMTTDGSALPFVNVSRSLLFVDGEAVPAKLATDTTPVVFVANRVLTHRLHFPIENSDASNIGLVVPIKPPEHSAHEPYWTLPLRGAPSIAEFISAGNADPITAANDSSANASAITDGTSTDTTQTHTETETETETEKEKEKEKEKESEDAITEPPFAPPWPEPPVVNALHDEVIEAAQNQLADLALQDFNNASPGADHTDAAVLPMDEVLGARFEDNQKYHVYLLQPSNESNQLSELLVSTDNPSKLKVQLYDLVNDNYGIALTKNTAKVPLSQLRIQKPTLLYLSKSKGALDYKILWRGMGEHTPGQEHEPNSFRSTNPDLVSILPRMRKVSENEYTLSGYLGAQDKTDYFVLETEQAGLVTLEASAGILGIYVGSKDYRSKKIDKRIFLPDILAMPGKNVFYIHGLKKDYTVKATVTPLTSRWHEMEPNDAPHLAHRLPIGQARTGRLPVAKDYDYYFFDWHKDGPLRFTAQSGTDGDISLWLYKDDKELMSFPASGAISEVVQLEAGSYDLLAYTKNPSLEPYTVQLLAENPLPVNTQNTDLALTIVADTNTVEPFSNKGQLIHGIARIENNGNTAVNAELSASSSHNRVFIDIPNAAVSVAPNSQVDVPFTTRVKRLSYAVGKVPLFFTLADNGNGVSAEWHLGFPYSSPPTPDVWHDQPLPEPFMGAFDVARTDFGAVVHEDVTCSCSPKASKSKTVAGTDVYSIQSHICGAAVHAGNIDAEGGVVRVKSLPGLTQYTGSNRNGFKSRSRKESKASFQFVEPANNAQNDVPACEKLLELNKTGAKNLLSGLPFRSYFYGDSVAINLVGDEPIELTGVILSLRGAHKNQLKTFAIDVSDNGDDFVEVFTGELALNDSQQPFVFDAPVTAAFVRVRLVNSFSDKKPPDLRLGAVQVMAAKNAALPMNAGLNLADPALGAHQFANSVGETVLSFHHNRAALINEITVVSKEAKAVTSIALETSEYGPYGPWTVIANEQLKAKSSLVIPIKAPTTAKYVRVSGNWNKKGKVFIDSVIEAPSDTQYRSILTEWGNQESDAFFELGVEPQANVAPSAIDSSAENPATVTVGDTISSTVSLPLELTDYYRVVVPNNTLSMQLQFNGDTQRTIVDITDANGQAIPYTEHNPPGGRSAEYTVSPLLGVSEFFVKVYDKPKHLAVLWDDSGSVSPYVPGLHRMLRNFAFDVDPRFEKINLMSLYDKNPRFLLNSWAESPFELLAAIRSYNSTGSSSAYINMDYALNQLNQVDGIKALLIMTDEQGDRSKYKNNKMENRLAESNTVVFSFHATSSKELHGINANHMQTWADIGGGRYTLIRSEKEVPDAIAKVQTWLRKPAVYEMQVSAVANTPGSLKVTSQQNSDTSAPIIAAGAVEVILDASGSMWKKMADGQPRIVVAKDVLLTLVSEKLPDKLPFALRVFGNRKAKSCRTDLEIPFGPLSRNKTLKKIQGINPQDRSKTPIGDSLAQVSKDLKKATGKKIIILITDGEETCNADPKAVISELKAQGFDVQVNIVGFAIDDEGLKQAFAEWAAIGGGDYFDTNDAEQLTSSLQESLVPQFTVTNSLGETVASGRLNGASVNLPPGDYAVSLSVEGYKPKLVTVPPGGGATVEF